MTRGRDEVQVESLDEKKFDCVDLMRRIRNVHTIKYEQDPGLRKRRLEETHITFGFATQEELQQSSE